MSNRLEIGQKTELLNEAFHYIDRYSQKVVVIKYGWSAMDDKEAQRSVLDDVVTLKKLGLRPVLVHGGGKEISEWSKKIGLTPTFKQGYRVTDEATMEVVEMVLNQVNKGLVNSIHELGGRAVGISGKDAGLLKVKKKYVAKENDPNGVGFDIGYVGEIVAVDSKIITDLLDKDYIPVICSVGFDENHHSFNINADDAACAVAMAMKSEKLAFLSDVPGIYKDPNDSSSLISELDCDKIDDILKHGQTIGGMITKLNNCKEVIKSGVERIHIMDANVPHSLLLEIFTDSGVGTMIRRS